MFWCRTNREPKNQEEEEPARVWNPHIQVCPGWEQRGRGGLYLTFKKFSSKRQNFCLLFLESIPFITETKNKPISINTRTESDSHINYPY